uniref:Uncharacterized protein n=1 Tax=Caenorhabditis japonica TaxID=281687 RepID=A0A8R1DQN8_CAEJA
MLIRSLIRVRLTKYFRSDIYIKNRCAGADAILIDLEKHDDRTDDDYKLRSFHRVRDSLYSLPKILVDPVASNPNPWIPKLITEESVSGLAIRSSAPSTIDFLDGVDPRCAEHDTLYTMIWDKQEERITHCIISYHRINDADTLFNSNIRAAVEGSLKNNIQPLAARTRRFRDMESAIQEFTILRQIGFTGAVIRNPNLIELTNNVFDEKNY